MTRLLPTLRIAACAALLLAGSAGFAQAPPAPAAQDAIAALQAAYARVATPGEAADRHAELLAVVLNRVQRSYASEVDLGPVTAAAIAALAPLEAGTGDPPDVFKRAINVALRTLDPYSRYLDPQAHSNDRGESTGSFGGVGLEVEPGDNVVRVILPMPGSPAAKAGVQAGDLIVRVDDHSLVGVPLADAIARMRGQPGTPVTITLRRAGIPDEWTVALTRDTIRRQVLRWNMEGDVLVLRLRTFSGPVSAALNEAIAEATAAHTPRGIVLDLRGNTGGLLREGVLTADAFLGKGEIVSLRGRTSSNLLSWQADANEHLPGVPMVVLLDERSASASELVAAALKENGRAEIMGSRSYGKGSVQTTYPLGDNRGALKLTTALYHGPSGRTVHKIGITPDIELLTAAAVAAAPSPGSAKVRVQQDRCASVYKAPDPALSCAVAYLIHGNLEALAPAPSGTPDFR
jgi:C-terminal peptidase prc